MKKTVIVLFALVACATLGATERKVVAESFTNTS